MSVRSFISIINAVLTTDILESLQPVSEHIIHYFLWSLKYLPKLYTLPLGDQQFSPILVWIWTNSVRVLQGNSSRQQNVEGMFECTRMNTGMCEYVCLCSQYVDRTQHTKRQQKKPTYTRSSISELLCCGDLCTCKGERMRFWSKFSSTTEHTHQMVSSTTVLHRILMTSPKQEANDPAA